MIKHICTNNLVNFKSFLLGYSTPLSGYNHQPNNALYFAPKIEEEWKTAYFGRASDFPRVSANQNIKTSINNQLTPLQSSSVKVNKFYLLLI